MCTRLRGLPIHDACHAEKYFYFFSIEKFKLLFTLKKSCSSRKSQQISPLHYSICLVLRGLELFCLEHVVFHLFVRCRSHRRSTLERVDVLLNLLNINYPALTRVSLRARFMKMKIPSPPLLHHSIKRDLNQICLPDIVTRRYLIFARTTCLIS